MGPAAARLADLSARVFLGAGVLELFLIVGSLLADARLIPIDQIVFNVPQCPLITLAFGAALTYLIVTRGGRRKARAPSADPARPRTGRAAAVTVLAWVVVVLSGGFMLLMVVGSIAVAFLMRDF